MKRALSIISIIFLLGITTAMPYFSCSSFVYADETTESLTNDQKIFAAYTTYLNNINAYLTVNQGTIEGLETIGTAYVDMFIDVYNANTPSSIINKAILLDKILIKYNPYRVSMAGEVIKFFNQYVNWLRSNNKIPDAESSNGGDTSDDFYDGLTANGEPFYVIDSTNNVNNIVQGIIIVTAEHVTPGMYVNGQSPEVLKAELLRKASNFSPDFNSYPSTPKQGKVGDLTVTYYPNVQGTFGFWWYPQVANWGADDLIPLYPRISTGYYSADANYYLRTTQVLYASRADHIVGFPIRFCYKNTSATKTYTGFASYNITKGYYNISSITEYTRENTPINVSDSSYNFETIDFDKTPETVPEEGKEVQYTPRDKTTGNTYNTYNQYINNYTNKNTVINKKVINEGDSGEDDPTTSTDPTQPTTQNPYPLDPTDPSAPTGGTIPDWTTPSGNGGSGTITPDGNGGYTFELPDFSLPDLDINWSISGLAEKFPFSIPFDLLAFFTVLNAEPQTPAIQATIPLGIWEWEIDWDLHDFDNLAGLLRNLEFIGFCIGLALITRNIIKG